MQTTEILKNAEPSSNILELKIIPRILWGIDTNAINQLYLVWDIILLLAPV